MNEHTVWVIDDDDSIRWVLEKALKQAGYYVHAFDNADEVLALMSKDTTLVPSAIISDIQMPGTNGIQMLQSLHGTHPDTPILIMTAFSDLDSTVSAFDSGAFDYIAKPFDIDKVIEQVNRACVPLAKDEDSTYANAPDHPVLLGDSPAMQSVYNAIGRLSRSNTTVLIGGESGTGKELIAQALHRHGPRASSPFIALNMAAIPAERMEAELFGVDGSGENSRRQIGRFEQANGGTLFLDEIGDMPMALQTGLLRVLEDGQFYPLGDQKAIETDVRIIAASHHALATRVDEGKFRADLFHRLNVIRIDAPRLSERRDDIPRLLQHFLDQAAAESGEPVKSFDRDFAHHVMALPWPGNVRELQNTARWLSVMAGGTELKVADLPDALLAIPENLDSDWESAFRQWVVLKLQRGEQDLLAQATPAMETILIQCALKQTQNKRQDAARLLGWGRNTLTRKIKELGLD